MNLRKSVRSYFSHSNGQRLTVAFVLALAVLSRLILSDSVTEALPYVAGLAGLLFLAAEAFRSRQQMSSDVSPARAAVRQGIFTGRVFTMSVLAGFATPNVYGIFSVLAGFIILRFAPFAVFRPGRFTLQVIPVVLAVTALMAALFFGFDAGAPGQAVLAGIPVSVFPFAPLILCLFAVFWFFDINSQKNGMLHTFLFSLVIIMISVYGGHGTDLWASVAAGKAGSQVQSASVWVLIVVYGGILSLQSDVLHYTMKATAVRLFLLLATGLTVFFVENRLSLTGMNAIILVLFLAPGLSSLAGSVLNRNQNYGSF